MVRILCAVLGTAIVVLCPGIALASDGGSSWEPPLWSPVFFAGLLVCIAVLPLLCGHWWEHNSNKGRIVALLGAPVALLVLHFDPESLVHALVEYVQFMCLIGSLYVVAGGLHLTGNLRATPTINTILLGIGYVLAPVIGTTGASMVMIYPLLRTNGERQWKSHTFVFYIVAVSNAGGLLTPLGDPPLFLGFLRGIPFLWFVQNLWVYWVSCGAYLLVLYFFVDSYFAKKEDAKHRIDDREHVEPMGLLGGFNILLLGGIVTATCMLVTPLRECAYVGCAALSLVYARVNEQAIEARKRNEFSWTPIVEVAVLFVGIFVTMIPALSLLSTHGGSLGVSQPWQYFVASGGFSSVLDNAPTFLVYLSLGMATTHAESAAGFAADDPRLLIAISLGAVLMGCNTYIGNAPNFMVKAVAERRGVKMPNFFAYAALAIAIMLPPYIVIMFF